MRNIKTKVVKQIIKTVGINGLIAIKADVKRSENSSIYKNSQYDSLDFTAQNLILHHLVMIKDFAQYQN